MQSVFAGLVLSLGLLSGCGDGDEDAAEADPTAFEVEAVDGWVQATTGAEDPSMTGAFMTIDNQGERQVTLTGASSPVSGMVELHEMAMQDGRKVMREIPGGLEIPAERGQMLMPGGHHIMLMGLEDELEAGDEVEVTLEFASGDEIELTLPVKEYTEEEPH
jgi:periplasmic copper chaperone A